MTTSTGFLRLAGSGQHKPGTHAGSATTAIEFVVDRALWIRIAAWNAEQVNYTNVKEEISRVHRVKSKYAHAVHQIWAVGMEWCREGFCADFK